MLRNKADVIEKYILDMLEGNGGEQIELKRTELADEVSCAPSQVSYVLSTRFTHSRGFRVESQRGLGGYIRITVVEDADQEKRRVYQHFIKTIEEQDINFDQAKTLLDIVLKEGYITVREAEILAQQVKAYYALFESGYMSEEVCKTLVHNVFVTLLQVT